MKYTIEDTSINISYPHMTEHDVRLYAVRVGVGKYSYIIDIPFVLVESLLLAHGHKLIKEENKVGYKGKMSKQVIRNVDSSDVELYFFELIEMNYNQLNDMLNDYLDLYNTFKEYSYRMNALIIMEAINTKKAREVSVS